MAPKAAICDAGISQWKPYFDEMGPKTREYVKSKVVEALGAGSEFGRGVLGLPTNLQLIAGMSSEAGDSLGRCYAYTMLNAAHQYSDLIKNPNLIGAARKNPSKFRRLLRSIRCGKAENIEQYVMELELID